MRGFDLSGETLHRLRVSHVERLVEAGAFDADGRHVELLDGVLVEMSAQGDPHAFMTSWLGAQLTRRLDDDYRVFQHSSLQIGLYSLPEPDVCVVARDQLHVPRRVRASVLVVEIAASSHVRDQRKSALYAAKRVPEYWLVDIPGEAVHVHTNPDGRSYRSVQIVGRNAVLRPIVLPAVRISVDEMFRENVFHRDPDPAPRGKRRPRRKH